MANRISILGSLVAAFGFFFLPLLEIKPNRLASGITIDLLEIQGDLSYVVLFILALIPIIVALQTDRSRRGWTLVGLGNLIMFLTLLLPAEAGSELLAQAGTMFPEGTRISNPRVFASSAIAVGLLGGYITLFGGLVDLQLERVSRLARTLAGSIGIFFMIILIINGNVDIYSILVEFHERGGTLGQRFIEHFVFVVVASLAGLVIGITLGLWATRDNRFEAIILYVVGIIQTIPSLALFGILLVPLARLGDQKFVTIAQITGLGIVIAVVMLVILVRFRNQMRPGLHSTILIISIAILLVPLSLSIIMAITFGFEAILTIFKSSDMMNYMLLVLMGFVSWPLINWLNLRINRSKTIKSLIYLRYIVLISAMLILSWLFFDASSQVIGNSKSLSDLTIRDFGVSGIGTAPALIALTLYSLLPLVRNTYAGLKNVDAAIIDAGKGMGMTPSQIFFKIELPLAFPVIMAGVRNAAISLVGIAAVASIIGAGALGDFILLGVNTTSIDLILLGAIPAIILAILLDILLQLFETVFTSPGIRQASQ